MSVDRGASGPTLLVVDDEARILSALRRTLRREGYEILTAETSAEALRLLETHSIDLVLSDHKMPGMSGIELLARVAEMCPGAARVLITGWTESVPADALERHKLSALIPKPWDNAGLKQTLRDVLAAR